MKNHGKKRFFGIFIFLAVFGLGTAVIMWLWNAIVPAVIGWGIISYWQAVGLALLCRLLFGGFGHHCRHAHHHFHKRHPMDDMMKHRSELARMSMNEREEFIRQRFHRNSECGNRESDEK